MLEGYSFIISGRVQGVYFRKYTCDQGNALGLVGNVRNNPDGTVSGVIASMDPARLQDMRDWLTTVGSPQSRIDSAAFEPLTAAQIRTLPRSFTVIRKPKK